MMIIGQCQTSYSASAILLDTNHQSISTLQMHNLIYLFSNILTLFAIVHEYQLLYFTAIVVIYHRTTFRYRLDLHIRLIHI